MDKPDMDSLIKSILPKKPDKAVTEEGEEKEGGGAKEAIASDLIDAIKSGDASAVTDALDAVQEAWARPSSKKSSGADEDCGCK